MPDDSRRSKPDVDTLKRGTVESRQIAEDARVLRELARHGSIDSVPWLMVSHAAVRALPLDERSSVVLSHVDGRRTIAAIVQASGLPVADCVAAVLDLIARRVLSLR
jgi:hypothetical protein